MHALSRWECPGASLAGRQRDPVPCNTEGLVHPLWCSGQGLGTPLGDFDGPGHPLCCGWAFPGGKGPTADLCTGRTGGHWASGQGFSNTHPEPLCPTLWCQGLCEAGSWQPGAAVSTPKVLSLIPVWMYSSLPRSEFTVTVSYLHQRAVQGLRQKACSGCGGLLCSLCNKFCYNRQKSFTNV